MTLGRSQPWLLIIGLALGVAFGCGKGRTGQLPSTDGADDGAGTTAGDTSVDRGAETSEGADTSGIDGGVNDRIADVDRGDDGLAADADDASDASSARDADAGDMNDAAGASDASSTSDGSTALDASPADASDAGNPGPWTHVFHDFLASWPPARSSATLIYDTGRHVTVMLSGQGNINGTIDTWDLDGATATWTNRQPTPPPASWPSMRSSFGAAYDSARARVVLFGGGATGGGFDELWEWDGVAGTWTNRTPATRPMAWPANQFSAEMTYDPDRGRAILFGGAGISTVSAGNMVYDELWEWDGAAGTWANRTPATRPAAWPRARFSNRMAYDSARKRVVLFGGQTSIDAEFIPTSTLDELWEWDGAAGTWANRTPAVLPPAWPGARALSSMAYDGVRGRVMVFGGLGGGAVLRDLWEWNGATGSWTDRALTPAPASAPGMRAGSGMTFDPMFGRLFLYGGYNPTPLDELYMWQPPAS